MTALSIEGGRPASKLLHFGLANQAELARRASITLVDFLTILAPLLAIAVAIQLLHVEQGLQLPTLMWLTLGGFAVHTWLPLGWRLPFFFFLNIAALVLLFGMMPAALTLGIGLLLIIVATLEMRRFYRAILLLVIVAVLVMVKSGVILGGALYQASGIIAALFMFRLMLYLYELPHEKEPVSVWQRIAYFFLLPNLIFLLFPIVDYKTFKRGFYAKPGFETYRKGLHWIALGVLHLLLYRVIYHYALIPAEEVQNPGQLAQYLVSGYALIIRLSGLFHLSAGIVCLFGYDLPRTFNNYFLASGFSDLWHRINSYWREFVMKVFYIPIHFRFKHLGSRGVFISVLLVFVVNFCLHAYQWFWIRGTVLITQTDILFWGILGILLAFNSVLLMKRNRQRRRKTYSFSGALQHAFKVAAMFIFMCLMWSMWTSGTLAKWSMIFYQVGVPTALQCGGLIAALLALVAIGVLYQYLVSREGIWGSILRFSPLNRPLLNGLIFAALCLLATAPVLEKVAPYLGTDLSVLTAEKLNRQDEALMFKGYYEELIVPNTLASRMWEVEERKKYVTNTLPGKRSHDAQTGRQRHSLADSWQTSKTLGMLEKIDAPPWRLYKPNHSFTFHGTTFTTNQFGLRDRQYTLEKPPGTYRIAQVGSSPELGMGVEDDQTSEYLLEQRLTKEGWGGYEQVEIINFSMGGYTLYEHLSMTQYQVGKFKPDAIMLYVHDKEPDSRFTKRLIRGIFKGHADDFPELLQQVKELTARKNFSRSNAEKMLRPHELMLYKTGFGLIERYCRENNIRLIIVYIGVINDSAPDSRANRATVYPFLRDRGHLFFDMADIFNTRPRDDLIVAPWDYHPNPLGQKMVADRLYELMLEHQDQILEE